jgi:hypothetical protein
VNRMATGALRPLEEFVSDPALTVACVLLILVSVAWVVVARMIWINLRRAARKAERAARLR